MPKGLEVVTKEAMNTREMHIMIHQNIPVEGSYLYLRYGWDEPVSVTVENIDGEIFVRFFPNSYPVRFRDIQIDATFERVDD